MANEARVFAEGVGPEVIVRTVTVADGTAIPKGSLLVFSGATRTAILHTAAQGPTCRPAGFATSSKTANDGRTEIGVQRTGVVVAYTDSVVTSGDLIRAGKTTANRVERVDTAAVGMSYQEKNAILARAIENIASGSAGKIALNLG